MATEITALPKLFIGIDIHKKSWSVHCNSNSKEHYSEDSTETVEQDFVCNQNRNTLSDQPPKTSSYGIERKKYRKG